ncbi:MAG: preprotein translocase subunit SecG [Chloroflexota bacterium]
MLGVLLQISSIIVSILLVVLILLQVRGGGLGSMMGGDTSGGVKRTRRGLEKTLYQITIALSIVFVGISILSFAFYQ